MTLTLSLILLVAAVAIAALLLFTVVIERRIARGFAPTGSFITIDGTRLHYVDSGSGPAVVMVHGLGGQSRHFSHSLQALLERDFRVVLVDRPGAGHSDKLRGGSSRIKAQGDAIAKLIDALGLERPLLVGHSLGGAIALSVALDHPRSISALALVAPLTQFQEQVPSAFRAMTIRSGPLRWLLSRTLLVPLGIVGSEATLAAVFGPEPAPADFPTAGGGLMSLRPAAFLAAASDLQAIPEDLPAMMRRYPDLSMPVGILFGTDDRILDWRTHGLGMRGTVPDLTLEPIAGGHMLPLTNPIATAAFIRRMAERMGATVLTPGTAS